MELEYNTVDNDGAKYISESESNGNVLDEMEMIDGDSFSSNTIENDKRSDTKKNLRIWTNTACTRRLIELYHELLPKVGRYGRFQKKIQMFKYIANKINKEFGENYTGDQVAGRLKNFYRGRNKHLKPPDLNKSLKGISNSSTVHVDISNYNLESMFDSEDDEKCSQVGKGSGKNEHEKSSAKAEFTNQQSKKLIRLYNLFIPNVGSNNQFKSKREVFEAISEEMEHEFNIKYSYSQWESRYKTIVRKAKRLISRENQLKLIEQKNNTSEVEYADTKNAKTIHEYSESDMENENYTQDSISMEDVFIENYDDNNHSSLHEKSFPKNEEKEESITNLDQFNTKILKFFDKDLMKEYLKMKERKIKLEEIRHNEIMEQLRKMNRTLLEMKYQC